MAEQKTYSMTSRLVSIPVDDGTQISAVVSVPKAFDHGTGVILAHGAGNDMEHPLLVSLSKGLTSAGLLTLRFNFPYREQGKKAPDSQKKLMLTWQRVSQFLKNHEEYQPKNIVAAGKSMGGRVASQMVSEGLLPASRLILLGYPLHAPGKKEKLRDAHLYGIKVPMLFFAGTRDPLCDLSMLQGVLKALKAPWVLEIIKGGNHSFRLPKSASTSPEQIYEQILHKTISWLQTETL